MNKKETRDIEKSSLPKVGIVIPAFNVERYIGECIESILKQTYENIAIAIVDDGSTDNTWEIIQKYMTGKYSVIRSIKTDNRGVMKARFTCISQLEDCDYILFVDADDYLLDKSIIEKCVEHMKSADMVCFNVINNGKTCFKSNKILHLTKKEGIKNILNRKYLDGNITACCYSYWYVRKNFKVLMCNNDDYVNKAAFVNSCEKIVIIPDVGYYYRVNCESQTHRKIRNADYIYYSHVCEFCADIRKKYPEYGTEADYFESQVLLWLVIGLNKYRELKELKIYKTAMEELSKHNKIYMFNKYFCFKDRITYLCINLHIFGILYKIYHSL